MLETLIVVLLVLWLLGFAVVGSQAIHLLLVLALILLLVRLLS